MVPRRRAKKCTNQMWILFGIQVVFVCTLMFSTYLFFGSSFRRHTRTQLDTEWCPRSDDVIDSVCVAKPSNGRLIGRAPAYGSRLGNDLFLFAAVIGLAEENGLDPVIDLETELTGVFRISSDVTLGGFHFDTGHLEPSRSNQTLCEQSAYRYDERLTSEVRLTCSDNVFMVGFFHSWKYFRSANSRVRRELTFLGTYLDSADEFLSGIDNPKDRSLQVQTVFIGVHVRRGDLLDNFNVVLGYTVADVAYLERAVTYFRDRLVGEVDDKTHALKLIFVVCSDDIHWSEQNVTLAVNTVHRDTVPSVAVETVFPRLDDELQELAILSQCNHTIMTVGVYGWWAGYLAGGITTYYKDFPRPRSLLAESFSGSDFFPPDWIGL